jgi:hypothetical protein
MTNILFSFTSANVAGRVVPLIEVRGRHWAIAQHTSVIATRTLPATLMDLFQQWDEGLSVQKGQLPHMVDYYFSEIGDLNQVVHMRADRGLKHREVRRAALFHAEPWQIVVKKLYTLIERMKNKIPMPTHFGPALSEASR